MIDLKIIINQQAMEQAREVISVSDEAFEELFDNFGIDGILVISKSLSAVEF